MSKAWNCEVLLTSQPLAFCYLILSLFGFIPTADVRRHPKIHPGYFQNAATRDVNHVPVKLDFICVCELWNGDSWLRCECARPAPG